MVTRPGENSFDLRSRKVVFDMWRLRHFVLCLLKFTFNHFLAAWFGVAAAIWALAGRLRSAVYRLTNDHHCLLKLRYLCADASSILTWHRFLERFYLRFDLHSVWRRHLLPQVT